MACLNKPSFMNKSVTRGIIYAEDGGELNLLTGFPFVTSCFFPIRRCGYTEEQQLKDKTLYATEIEKDRTTLDNFCFLSIVRAVRWILLSFPSGGSIHTHLVQRMCAQ